MRRSAALVAISFVALGVIAVSAAPLGCTQILGDFSSGVASDAGDATSPGPDASDAHTADTHVPHDATPTDGEAAAPLQLLSCSPSSATSLVLATIPPSDSGGGSGNGPFDKIYVEHVPGSSTARVVAALSSPKPSIAVYTVPESGGGGSIQTETLPSAVLKGELKTTGAVTFLSNDFMSKTFVLYSIPDSDPGDSDAASDSVATIGSLPDGGGMMMNGTLQMSFTQLVTDNFYTLAAYTVSGENADLASWASSQMPAAWQILLGPGPGVNLGPLVPSGALVYAFGPPPSALTMGGGPSIVDQYTFKTTSTSAPATRTITAPDASAVTLATAADPSGFSFAFAEIVGAQSAEMRVGNVSAADISTFKVDDLPKLAFNVASDAGLFDTTPFGGSNGPAARWLSNGDFGIIGRGGTGGGDYTGLNFYVATPDGQWLIEMAGTGKNVFPGHTINVRGFDLASSTASLAAKFDLAWVEMQSDGSYVLYFNQLACVAG